VQTSTAGVVRTLPVQPAQQDEEALLDGLQDGEAWAKVALFDRYAPHVERILGRVLGRDPELTDVLHDTFVQAYASVAGIRDAHALKGWLSTVAVFTARGVIRKRKLRRWLRFWDPSELPEQHAAVAEPTTREALERSYAILDTMDADERIAFSLRFVDGMELTEVASACSCSLATVKRRLSRAEKKFLEAARGDAILSGRIEGGRWADR
jgi:RNA polymerase sigma-70 factor (ECF subfamily)